MTVQSTGSALKGIIIKNDLKQLKSLASDYIPETVFEWFTIAVLIIIV